MSCAYKLGLAVSCSDCKNISSAHSRHEASEEASDTIPKTAWAPVEEVWVSRLQGLQDKVKKMSCFDSLDSKPFGSFCPVSHCAGSPRDVDPDMVGVNSLPV